jgi:hypothetical protein
MAFGKLSRILRQAQDERNMAFGKLSPILRQAQDERNMAFGKLSPSFDKPRMNRVQAQPDPPDGRAGRRSDGGRPHD